VAVAVSVITIMIMILAFQCVLLISNILGPRILPQLISKYSYTLFSALYLRQMFLLMRPTILASKLAETWKAEFRFQKSRQNNEVIESDTLNIISK
jgi:hypothetical protein